MPSEIKNLSQATADHIRNACIQKKLLRIVGSDNKQFYGEKVEGETLSLKGHKGIISYEPSELYISAHAGTPLSEIETVLQEQQQMLSFEPPHLGCDATLGACIACGLSGPGRMAYGTVRDALLGVSIINGRGEILHFGGKVMKNVAGYDVSRLICGSFGTLGVILTITLRVMPIPQHQKTVCIEISKQKISSYINQQLLDGVPISASFYTDGLLYLRLSGWRQNITSRFANENTLDDEMDFWQSIKEQQHQFFQQAQASRYALWRISLPANAPTDKLPAGPQALEWNGALRWLSSDAEPSVIRAVTEQLHGHATLFKTYNNTGTTTIFHPLKPQMLKLHQRIKKAFDPENILNANRLYPGV